MRASEKWWPTLPAQRPDDGLAPSGLPDTHCAPRTMTTEAAIDVRRARIALEAGPPEAVELRSLTKVYAGSRRTPPKKALDSVDLTIPRGALFGLLGPNGAGKSTIINILAGLVTKTSGTACLWGIDIDSEPRQARAAIGVVPQELNIDPFFTPRELLDLHAGLYGVPKAERRTDEILATVGLTD